MRFRRFVRRRSQALALVAVIAASILGMVSCASAQTITFPQPNAALRGTVKVLFEGVPDGGYAMIYLDGKGLSNLREATTKPFHILNTFTLPDGSHTLSVVAFNAAGKRIGQSDVSFQVSNNSVDTEAEGVSLVNWKNSDIYDDSVRRYRIFAESSVTVEGGSGGGGAAAGGAAGAAGGDASAEDTYIPAPFDWQIDMLVRRVVRDVGLTDNSANIKSVLSEAYQRQRLSEQGGGAETESGQKVKKKKKKKGQISAPTKAPWGEWYASPQAGRYAVKTIKANGDEINATRKPATLGLADLLPRFPQGQVRPGSTWQSDMTIVGEIPEATGINVQAPMTFTGFENLQSPAGKEKRTAKLESRFNLPLDAATRVARSIQKQVGSGGGLAGQGAGGGSTGMTGGAGGAGADVEPPDFVSVNVSVTREIWFDISGTQILRAEDTVNTNYEEEVEEDAGGGGAAAGGEAASGTKVSYNLRISKYLDDTIPPPTDAFTAGAGTAHSRDRVQDPSIARVLRGK